MLSKEDRILIKIIRIEKGYGARKLISEFPRKNWSLASVHRLLCKIDKTGSADRKLGSGRRRTARTEENINAVENLVLSQESAPGTHRTVRQISRETGIAKSSVHDIIHCDLKLKCFKKERAQNLTEDNKNRRLVCAKQLLKRFPMHSVSFIWFTDEKLFTVAPPVNPQNDRLYATARTLKKQVPPERLLRKRPTFSKSVMVSVGVSSLGCTDLIFVEPVAKINGAYYRDTLLHQHLLPAIRSVSGEFFTFQQDGAPAHRARETVALLAAETPDFISPQQWPPNSPDLNPVDYTIWGVLQERVYRCAIRDVNHLKERLVEEWHRFDQKIIDASVSQWKNRLRKCISEKGGHFEHLI